MVQKLYVTLLYNLGGYVFWKKSVWFFFNSTHWHTFMSIHCFEVKIWGLYSSICQVFVPKIFGPYDLPIDRYAKISAKLAFGKKWGKWQNTGLARMRCHKVKKIFFTTHLVWSIFVLSNKFSWLLQLAVHKGMPMGGIEKKSNRLFPKTLYTIWVSA
jgi:hypothetical protein